uniref:Uncharacterized protein n=1 Tax=Anguilla anguilla TaxID=7936 RepID=A0A0E9Q1G7_ANGAN
MLAKLNPCYPFSTSNMSNIGVLPFFNSTSRECAHQDAPYAMSQAPFSFGLISPIKL